MDEKALIQAWRERRANRIAQKNDVNIDEWKEELHPRDKGGQFTHKGGGSAAPVTFGEEFRRKFEEKATKAVLKSLNHGRWQSQDVANSWFHKAIRSYMKSDDYKNSTKDGQILPDHVFDSLAAHSPMGSSMKVGDTTYYVVRPEDPTKHLMWGKKGRGGKLSSESPVIVARKVRDYLHKGHDIKEVAVSFGDGENKKMFDLSRPFHPRTTG